MKLTIKLLSALLALGTLACAVPKTAFAQTAAARENQITISSAEELIEFGKSCALDSWSENLTVKLTSDINLQYAEFEPIPIFSGKFDGGGHTVSGLKITKAGTNIGLFRILPRGAELVNLNVTGTITPTGKMTNVGAFVGENCGTIRNCSFYGTVKGDENIGGLVGENAESGRIISCKSAGYIGGKTACGGIAGKSEGVILKCENSAAVNSRAADDSLTLPDNIDIDATQTIDSLTDNEDKEKLRNTCTDSGGICGNSSGVLQSCVNLGKVGYPHVGYNAGGIAGRQSGLLSDCSNSGAINGRKDVGGIVGQAEPYLFVSPEVDSIERIRVELDALNVMITGALNDTDKLSDNAYAHLTAIRAETKSAQSAAQAVVSTVNDFTDGNIEVVNTLSADIVGAIEKIGPAVEEIGGAGKELTALSDKLNDAFDELSRLADTSDNALKSGKEAIEKLSDSAKALETAAAHLKEAVTALQNGVLEDDLSAADDALDGISEALTALSEITGDFNEIIKQISESLKSQIPDTEKLDDDVKQLQAALEQTSAALKIIADNTPQLKSDISKAGELLGSAAEELNKAGKALGTALDALDETLTALEPASGELKNAYKSLGEAADIAADIGDKIGGGVSDIGKALTKFSERGKSPFKPLGEKFRTESDSLFDSVTAISEEAGALTDDAKADGERLSGDLKQINNQIKRVYDAVLDAFEEAVNYSDNLDEIITDTSDEDFENVREGKVGNCLNTGGVEGDRNIGGIAGAVGLELDSDPEDELKNKFSYGATYQTKTVISYCVNNGEVYAKKECAGGIAGRMELGAVIHSENYGDISTDGSCVGGISGQSDAVIRSCYAKSRLSGTENVGGIAGKAKLIFDCAAIATILNGSESVGAIVGKPDIESGALRGNKFLDMGTAGTDGISYSGKTEPISFEELKKLPEIPKEMLSFNIIFKADNKVVKTIPFNYGDDLSKITLPEIPAKDGNYGEWEKFDTTGKQSDLTVNAVYEPWITLLGGSAAEGKMVLAFVEGQFTKNALLEVSESDAVLPRKDGRALKLSLSGTELSGDSEIPVRLYNPYGDKGEVMRYENGSWSEVETNQNGKYLTFKMTGTENVFCVVKKSSAAPFIIAGAALGIAAVIITVAANKSKSRKKIANR